MALATLSVDLIAKVASFETDLKRAAKAAEDQSSKISRAFGTVAGGLAGIAAGFSVGAIASFVAETNNAIDALNDVSDATGSSIENISALEDVARRTGASLDTVGSILVKFNQVLASADPDSKAAKSLEAIGLSAKELQQLDPAEALRQTAVALSQFADDGTKARLVQDLFGKSVREAAPFLKDLAEQGGLNATVTTDQALAAEKFNKQLANLQTEASNAARALVGKLIPALSQVFSDVATFSEKASLASLAGDVLTFKKQLDSLEARKGSAFNFAGDLDAEIAKTKVKLAEAKRLFNEADVGRPKSAGAGRGFVVPEAPKPKIEIEPEDPNAKKRESERAAAARKLAQEAEREAKEQLDRDLKVGELRNRLAGEQYAERVRNQQGLEQLLDNIAEKERERLQLLLDDTPTNKLEKQRETMQFLADAFESGKISAEQFGEAASASLGNIAKESEKANDFAKDLGLSFTSAFEDAVVGGKKASDVLKGLGDDILRIITRKAVTEPLGNALSGALGGLFGGGSGGAGGGLGGLFSSLFSFSGGGYTGSGSRSGGVDGKGGFPAILHPNETVLDHSMGQGMGSKVTVNVINQGGAMQVQSQSQRTGPDGGLTIDVIVRAVETGLADNVANRSGPLSRALEGGYGLRPSMG
jgi:hypothetical protein